jgi:hypothetical protein
MSSRQEFATAMFLSAKVPESFLTFIPFEAFSNDVNALTALGKTSELPTRWLTVVTIAFSFSEARPKARAQHALDWIENAAQDGPDSVFQRLGGACKTVSDFPSLMRALASFMDEMLEHGAVHLAYALATNLRLATFDSTDDLKAFTLALQIRSLRHMGREEQARDLEEERVNKHERSRLPFECFSLDADALERLGKQSELPVRWLATTQLTWVLAEAMPNERDARVAEWVNVVFTDGEPNAFSHFGDAASAVTDLESFVRTAAAQIDDMLKHGAAHMAFATATNLRLVVFDVSHELESLTRSYQERAVRRLRTIKRRQAREAREGTSA